jgi:PAS domain S-box-containing protein
MAQDHVDHEQDLRQEIALASAKLAELRSRLEEPEEIVRAIREGEVDAFVVTGRRGETIYCLRSVDPLYRRMVEEMQEGAVVLESSGLVVYANPYFNTLMKTTHSELVGKSIFRFVPEDSRSFFNRVLPPAVSEVERDEFVLRTSDGALVPVHGSMSRIEIDEGAVYCLIVTDLTLERRRDELLTQSRRYDEFIAMLAHELRNPIAPIRNAAHVVGMSDSDPRAQWARDVIERQVVQLSRMVDDLLDISRITRGKIRLDLEACDLTTIITRSIETAQPAIEARRHELSVTLPNERLPVTGDATRLSQVISNVLHNAAKFTPEGGKIALRAERAQSEIRISIRDTGVGIRRELLPNVFDLFTQGDSTLERSQGGLGIGLALVRNLIEMHGGRVEASSEGPGKGSEFVLVLPLGKEARRLERETSLRESAPFVKRRVLVVDDNLDAAESLSLFLTELGHETRTLTEGQRVVEVAREFGPHVVVLDISLPDVSGFELARELRKLPELRGTRLVALTGYSQDEHRRRSQEAGFDQHWIKPVDLGVLERFLSSPSP